MYYILATTDNGAFFITKINRAMIKNDEGVSMKIPNKITIDAGGKPAQIGSKREAEFICDAIYRNIKEFPFINEAYVVTAPNRIEKQPQRFSSRNTSFRFSIEGTFTCPLIVPEGFSWDRDYFKNTED